MKDKLSNIFWLPEHEPRPEALKTGFRSRKSMFTIFFNCQGPILFDIMPQKSIITTAYFTSSFKSKNITNETEFLDARLLAILLTVKFQQSVQRK